MTERNRDWKPIAALVLAGLALFVALSGRWSLSMSGGSDNQVGQAYIQPIPPVVQMMPTVVPAAPMPQMPQMNVPPVPPAVEQHFWQGTGASHWGPFGSTG